MYSREVPTPTQYCLGGRSGRHWRRCTRSSGQTKSVRWIRVKQRRVHVQTEVRQPRKRAPRCWSTQCSHKRQFKGSELALLFALLRRSRSDVQGGPLALGPVRLSKLGMALPFDPLFGPLWEVREIEISMLEPDVEPLSWFEPPFWGTNNIKVGVYKKKMKHPVDRPKMHVV